MPALLVLADQAPFPLDAIVEEEDRFLVLSADPEFRDPGPLHPIRLHTELLDVEPRALGEVVVRSRHGRLELLAVVHDLDREPSTDATIVKAALERILGEVERRAIQTLGLPLLGAVHGGIPSEASHALIREALERAPVCLARVWLELGTIRG